MSGSGKPSFGGSPRFGYFVLQAQVAGDHGGIALTGVLENLATGEKQVFTGSDALALLLEDWGRRTGHGP